MPHGADSSSRDLFNYGGGEGRGDSKSADREGLGLLSPRPPGHKGRCPHLGEAAAGPPCASPGHRKGPLCDTLPRTDQGWGEGGAAPPAKPWVWRGAEWEPRAVLPGGQCVRLGPGWNAQWGPSCAPLLG